MCMSARCHGSAWVDHGRRTSMSHIDAVARNFVQRRSVDDNLVSTLICRQLRLQRVRTIAEQEMHPAID